MIRLTGAVALALLMTAQQALAGDAAADALFRAGREAATKGDYATACARFEESNRLEPAVGTAFNLAYCHEQLGQVASAWRRYAEVKDRLPLGDERAKISDQRMRALEPKLPRLTLGLAPGVKTATVLYDGVVLGTASLGIALPIDPGSHEVVVRVLGRSDRKVTFEIKEGEKKELVLQPGEPEAIEPVEPARTSGAKTGSAVRMTGDQGSNSQRTWGYVIGGAGVAGIVTSLVTGALVLSSKSTVEAECKDKLCSPEGVRAGENGRRMSMVSTIAFSIGAAGVGIGTYLILSAPDKKEGPRLQAEAQRGRFMLSVASRFQ